MKDEVCDLPFYGGLGDINTFLEEYEEKVPEYQILLALDIALRDTPTRWWGTHKKDIVTWKECLRLIRIRFGQVETKLEDNVEILNNMTLIHRDYLDYTLFMECMHNT